MKQQENKAQEILNMLNDIWNILEEKPKLSDFDSLLKVDEEAFDEIEDNLKFTRIDGQMSASVILANIVEKLTEKVIIPKTEKINNEEIIVNWQILEDDDKFSSMDILEVEK